MKNHLRKRFILLLLAIILDLTTACYALSDNSKETSRNLIMRNYTIDSATILSSLDRGAMNVFTLQEATPRAISSLVGGEVSWGQADYLRVAQALNQEVWHLPLDEKTLFNMEFEIDCSQVERGAFTYAVFNSFQIIQVGNEKTRFEYSVGIYPSRNEVFTSKLEHYPSLGIYTPIDLSEYRISAEDALQIAERNGGNGKRAAIKNACSIKLIDPGPNEKGWNVTYKYKDTRDRFLEFFINPQTGAIKVLFPKP